MLFQFLLVAHPVEHHREQKIYEQEYVWQSVRLSCPHNSYDIQS